MSLGLVNGLPHAGHAFPRVLMYSPQAGHLTKAISVSPVMVFGGMDGGNSAVALRTRNQPRHRLPLCATHTPANRLHLYHFAPLKSILIQSARIRNNQCVDASMSCHYVRHVRMTNTGGIACGMANDYRNRRDPSSPTRREKHGSYQVLRMWQRRFGAC